jgi:hypothetical protein
VQIYSEYTKRYQEIITRFPEDINDAAFNLTGRSDYNQVMRAMRTYFDLCFEEWHLHERKLIRKDIWSVWSGGIKVALSKPAFVQAWAVVDKTSDFGRGFEAFIRSASASPDCGG